MSEAAAFQGTYADWKLIKTRSVVQIVLEIPIEQSDLAYQVLGGMPNPAEERWLGVARLGETPRPAEAAGPAQSDDCGEQQDRPHKPRKPVAAEKRLAQQAGMLASDALFNRYLAEEHKWYPADGDAATFIRAACGVKSRAEIIPGTPAADIWIDIESRFTAWKLVA